MRPLPDNRSLILAPPALPDAYNGIYNEMKVMRADNCYAVVPEFRGGCRLTCPKFQGGAFGTLPRSAGQPVFIRSAVAYPKARLTFIFRA